VTTRALLLITALAAALTACGDASQPTEPPSTPPDGPLVTYERGGGIAGQAQRLVIQRDGRARLEVRTGTGLDRTSFTLTPAQLEPLEGALTAARGADTPEPDYGCADCFEYSVRADGVRIELDSVSYSDADTPDELVRVVALLEHLADR
jgi:hypothetical protein